MLNPMTFVAIALAVALAIAMSRLYKKDVTAAGNLRRQLGELSTLATGIGFVVVPKLLSDLAFGQVRTFIHDASKAVRDLLAPGGLQAEADVLFVNMFKNKLKDPLQAANLLAQAQQAVKANVSPILAA